LADVLFQDKVEMAHLNFRDWLHLALVWSLMTTGFALWLWASNPGSALGLILMVFTGHYAFTKRHERTAALGRQVGKGELIATTLLIAGACLLLALAVFTQGRALSSGDLKERLREPIFALALYALMVGPTVWRWHGRLARTKSDESQPEGQP
jgi:hypothetical protein